MVWQLITWPASGLMWIAEEIMNAAEVDTDEKSRLQRELTALQIAFDFGESLVEVFLNQKSELLKALEAFDEF